jgi:glycosyltransferase involved in cell wall biosynthesis
VLYIDGVGPFGGGQRSLFEAMRAMPSDEVVRYFFVQRGTANKLYAEIAEGLVAVAGVSRFDHTAFSHYRGARWLVTLREIGYLPHMILGLRRAKREFGSVDVIHVNEVTEIIPGLLAKVIFKAPLVVHVRSPQRLFAKSRRDRWLERILTTQVEAVVAIDQSVQATMPNVPSEVIHNSFTANPRSKAHVEYLERLDQLPPTSLKVGFIGNVHLAKGIFELLEATEMLVGKGLEIDVVVVGGETATSKGLKWRILNALGLAQNQYEALTERLESSPAKLNFHLFGSTWDIAHVLPKFDVVAFATRLNSPGRPVFEAAHFGVPSIVAVDDPKPDTIQHMETGIVVPRPDPELIAAALTYLAENRSEARRMGQNAKALARKNFDPQANAQQLLELYRRVAAAWPLRGDHSLAKSHD